MIHVGTKRERYLRGNICLLVCLPFERLCRQTPPLFYNVFCFRQAHAVLSLGSAYFKVVSILKIFVVNQYLFETQARNLYLFTN